MVIVVDVWRVTSDESQCREREESNMERERKCTGEHRPPAAGAAVCARLCAAVRGAVFVWQQQEQKKNEKKRKEVFDENLSMKNRPTAS